MFESYIPRGKLGRTEKIAVVAKRLEAGEGRTEALRQAQLGMLKGPQRNESAQSQSTQFVKDVEKKANQARSHPFYRAGFIPIGDWRSLDGKDPGMKENPTIRHKQSEPRKQ